jgi:hypothetical protein
MDDVKRSRGLLMSLYYFLPPITLLRALLIANLRLRVERDRREAHRLSQISPSQCAEQCGDLAVNVRSLPDD